MVYRPGFTNVEYRYGVTNMEYRYGITNRKYRYGVINMKYSRKLWWVNLATEQHFAILKSTNASTLYKSVKLFSYSNRTGVNFLLPYSNEWHLHVSMMLFSLWSLITCSYTLRV